MRKLSLSTSIATGFIGGVVFIVGCGSDSVVSAAENIWSNVGTTIFYTDGNVGVGTNTPEGPLTVKKSRTGPAFSILNESTDNRIHQLSSNTNEDAYYIGYDANGNEKWRIESNGDSHFSGGNIGIGTSTPASKLAVSGLPTTAPDASGNAGVVCATNNGNFWLDNDGTADCL